MLCRVVAILVILAVKHALPKLIVNAIHVQILIIIILIFTYVHMIVLKEHSNKIVQ